MTSKKLKTYIKNFGILFALVLFLVAGYKISTRPAYAEPSKYLNFQGRILNSSGGLVPDGYYNIQFKIYSASSGGSALWTESYFDSNGVTAGNDNRLRVVNGYFSANLGSQTAFSGINWDQQMWLTMNIGGSTQTATPTYDGEMNPRIQLTAVPVAFVANNVNSGDTQSTSTNSNAVSIKSGNATGATSNSGNITVDVGTATGTAGTISIGTANTSGITIGRVGVGTTINNSLSVVGSLGTISTSSTGNNLNFSRAGANYITATDVSGSLGLGVAGSLSAIGIASNGSLSFAGASTFSAAGTALTVTNNASIGGNLAVTGGTTVDTLTVGTTTGAGSLVLKPGSADHAYIQFFADTAAPTTRSGYLGYTAAGSTTLTFANEIGDQINLGVGTDDVTVSDQLTVTGNSSVGGTLGVTGSLQVAGGYQTYYGQSYSVPTATNVNINLTSTATTLVDGMQYRVMLSTTGTGTSNGAVYIIYETASNVWASRLVSAAGTNSNHPLLGISGSNVYVYHNHASTYNIRTQVYGYSSGNAFTNSSYFGLDGAMTNLGGNIGVGNSNPTSLLSVGPSSEFQVNSSGAIAAVTGITTSGGYTQTGTGANTLSGPTSLTASGTALSVTNNASIGGTLGVTGLITATGGINVASSAGYYYGGTTSPMNVELTRALPTTVNDFVEIGNFFVNSGAHIIRLSTTVNAAGNSISKTYEVPIEYNATSNTWFTLLPSSDTGLYSGNNFDVDLLVNNHTASFRIRRTAGTSAADVKIRVESVGSTTDAFTATTATGSATAPTSTYGRIYQDMLGNVGIGTTAPTTALQVVGSGYFGSTGNTTLSVDRGATTNTGLLQYYTGGAFRWGTGLVANSTDDYAISTDGTAAGAKLYIQRSTGNVGIGTSSPVNGALEVQGNSGVSAYFQSSNDSTITLRGTDTWSGITFLDANGLDRLWFNGGNSAFSIGGGGSSSGTKKLHVDGGVTIGSNLDNSSAPTNGILIEGSYTQTGTAANTFTGATSLTASGTALSVTNSATVGGRLGVGIAAPTSNVFLEVNGSTLTRGADVRTDTSGVYTYEGVARFRDNTGDLDGALVLDVPDGGNTMLKIRISGYNYGAAGGWEVIASGYHYNTGGTWINTSTEIRGQAPFSRVRFMMESGAPRIVLGDSTDLDNWDYPNVTVDVDLAGYTNTDLYYSGWALGLDTALTGFTAGTEPTIRQTAYTSNVFLQGGNSFGATALIGTNDAQSLAFETGGTTKLTISTTGVASLTGSLVVTGTEGVKLIGTGTTGIASIGYQSFFDSNGTTRYGFIGDASATDNDIYLRADTGSQLLLGSSGATRLTIDTSGNSTFSGGVTINGAGTGLSVTNNARVLGSLAVGPNAASDNLTVNGGLGVDLSFGIRAQTAGGASTRSIFTQGAATGALTLAVDPGGNGSARNFTLNVGTATNVLYANGSGSIGIGTATPATRLSVVGGDFLVNKNALGDANSGIRLVSQVATTHFNWQIGAQANVGGLEFTPSTVAGGTSFTNPAMVILTGGNVGIGDTSPASLLTVGATDAFQVNNDGMVLLGNSGDSFGNSVIGFSNGASLNTAVQGYGINGEAYNSGSAGVMGLNLIAGSSYAGTVSELRGANLRTRTLNVSTAVTNSYTIFANNPLITAGSITNNYGLYIADQTSGTNDYGIAILGADTQALWVGSGANNTDAANGIAFGSSRDTNLYRSAADTLRTDDALSVGGDSSVAGSFTLSGGTLLMNNATSNTINLSANGLGAPTTTTRSAGTKLVLWNGMSGSTTDYGIGIESGALWNSVTSSSAQFKWYAGITEVASLSGSGALTLNGGISATTGTFTAAGTALSVTNNATIGGVLRVGGGAVQSLPDGTGAAFTPQLTNFQTTGVSGIGVGVTDGTNNRRAALIVDQTNAVWGLTSTFSSGAIPFIIRQASNEWVRIDTSGSADFMGGLTAGSSNAFSVNTSGAITALTGVTTTGGYTQTGTGANTFSGASSFTASGTALSVTNNASVGGAITLGNTAVERAFQITFPNGVADQKFDLYFSQFWGEMDVTLTSSYANQNASGAIAKKFFLGLNPSNSVYNNDARYTESSGATPDNFAISNVTWDAANSRYRIQIVHRTSTGNSVYIRVKALATGSVQAAEIANNMAMSAIYTTDTTAFAKPVVTFDENVDFVTGDILTAGTIRVTNAGALQNIASISTSGGYTQTGSVSNLFTGLTTLNGGLSVEAGDTFTFNSDAFTDLTGSGLVLSSGALTVDDTSATGFFRNGGNSVGATAILGTNGAFGLNVKTNNTTRLSIGSSGATTLTGGTTGDALTINNSSSTGNILVLQDGGTPVLTVADGGNVTMSGNLLASSSVTGNTGTTNASGSNSTIISLSTDPFSLNDVVFIDNAGQDFYTRIVADPGTGFYTVSPAVTYESGVAVTKHNIQNVGATGSDYTTTANRFYQGFFTGGVVTGTGSTIYSDANILSTSTSGLKVISTGATFSAMQIDNGTSAANILNLQSNGSTVFNVGDNGTITAWGSYSQTGTSTNTFTGATTFSASGTALSVTNNATVSGILTVGTSNATNDILGANDGNDLDIGSYGGVAINLDVNQASVGNTSNLTVFNGSGTQILQLAESGALTVLGAINGQTISSAANFTGTVAIGGQISLSSGTANDLYFTPDGLFDISSNGNVAINLDANASSGVDASFSVKNDAGSNLIVISEAGTTDLNTSVELDLVAGGGANGVCHTGAAAAGAASNRQLTACSAAAADYAEFYPTEIGVEAGDIVAITGNMLNYEAKGFNPETGLEVSMGNRQISILKKSQAGDFGFGIVSTAPYRTIGTDVPVTANRKPIALNGRVLVKVNNEGGAISAGDRVAVSSVAGYGKKATEAGFTVGVALEPFNGTTGEIMVYVQNTYYTPPTSSANLLNGGTINGNLNITGSLNVSGATSLASLTVTGNANVSGNLVVVGNINTKNIVVSGKIITSGNAPVSVVSTDAKGMNATVSVAGNDIAGSITYDSGSTNLPQHYMNAGKQIEVTFTEAYTSAPRVALTSKNDKSASIRYYIETTTTGFTVHFVDAPVEASQYIFDYIIVQ